MSFDLTKLSFELVEDEAYLERAEVVDVSFGSSIFLWF
jgi:hypothetical protein